MGAVLDGLPSCHLEAFQVKFRPRRPRVVQPANLGHISSRVSLERRVYSPDRPRVEELSCTGHSVKNYPSPARKPSLPQYAQVAPPPPAAHPPTHPPDPSANLGSSHPNFFSAIQTNEKLIKFSIEKPQPFPGTNLPTPHKGSNRRGGIGKSNIYIGYSTTVHCSDAQSSTTNCRTHRPTS